jgi:hypothetical protein
MAAVLVVGAALLVLNRCASGSFAPVERLEPGWAAVRIHYDEDGDREPIPTGGYITFNPLTERTARYPVAQHSTGPAARDAGVRLRRR